MMLIADSGSTKTAWRIIDPKGKISQAVSKGINPYYMKSADIAASIQEGLSEYLDAKITEVFFYGAGCSSDKNKETISDAISRLYSDATITINHDLMAAARALCGHQKGIACILGTGSNSCLYDGESIVENVTSMGYLLGDEGSGNMLGRMLIKRYFKQQLPDELKAKFDERFQLSKSEILERIYQGEMPIRFLASFAKFIFQHIQHPYFYQMVYDCFQEFFEENVCKYTGYKEVPVHFTGSVAFYFSNILRKVGAELGITVGIISEDPIAGLALYHSK
ncbi:N-acetylglucosamine kinase [Reichenbachiella agarivorans]|uniref:N-acetylglucosamine kinase n=1 Tax=Reichenbachiella agarivorans TaxID=2979464 RepID=A0ABY6CKK9_9BACT|nr:BadF/BadG/BcrA/BcrD ATPase family protein [Reichenbachiella agarivorans]UXP31051.1 N-acetylglucosamine kinase [Reichenbachiella agarivorans]